MTQGEAATLILIASAAFVLPLLGRRLRMPAVVLEILFGIAIGPVFGLVQPSELVEVLAEFGLLLLLFLAGFEIELEVFERQGMMPILVGLGIYALTVAGSVTIGLALGVGLFVALVLATNSVGVIIPTLRGTRMIGTSLGQDILVAALLADILTLLAVTGFALTTEYGFGVRLLAIPAFFLIAGTGLAMLRRAAWWRPERFGRLFAADDPEELGIRASLALMLVFVGLSLVLGIESILGAFLAGTAFAAVFRHRGGLDEKLTGFSYGFFIPIFFINVGIGFRIDAILDPAAIRLTLLLLVAALAVKVLPGLLLVARRHSLRESLAAGALLSARLSLIIAIAELGVELELISETMESSIILLAAVTATLAPTLFRLLLPPQRGDPDEAAAPPVDSHREGPVHVPGAGLR